MAEKNLNELPPDLRKLFTRGHDALQRENFDYAMELLTQVLEKEPNVFECRKELRAAQLAKAGRRGGFFKKMFSSAGASPHIAKAQIALHKNPAEALAIVEQILNTDPFNSAAHRLVVEAARLMEMPKTAALSLEVLQGNSPKDKSLAIECATAMAEAGEGSRAEKILMEFVSARPNDGELLQALKNVSASKTLDEGGYNALAGGEGSYRDILKDEGEAVALEQEKRVMKTDDIAARLIAEYETRLQTEPNNLKLLRSLAELYTQKKQFEQALAAYDRVKSSEMGNDPSLDRAIAETKVRRYEHQIEQLDKTAPNYAEQAEKLRAEKLNFQITECQRRVERFPTDLSIRFEMGELYFEAGKIGEAISEFQKAQSNPHKRIAAMSHLAQCFARRRMFDLAARTLHNAIKEKIIFDEEKKDLLYNLGLVLESMGKKDEAIEQFKLIYEVDIAYRDVAAKVDAYYAAQ